MNILNIQAALTFPFLYKPPVLCYNNTKIKQRGLAMSVRKTLSFLLILILAAGLLCGCVFRQKTTSDSSKISEEQAKETVFADAGVEEGAVSQFKISLETDDRRQVYEIEFQADSMHYDYTVDAGNGQIIDYDKERISTSAGPSSQPSGQAVSEADAKNMALERVPGATADNLVAFKIDDGCYEGEILYNNTEYEFKISCSTGDFVKWEEEAAHH